ncbi:MAG TPA: hypothetical protein VK348_05155, partial [Planctomycetota bacterium]|nr:hypothetical protein [Planctomycetota bacterium]
MPDPAPAQRLVAQAAELVGRYRRQGGSPRELLAQRAGDRDQVAAAELASLFYGVVAHRRRLEYALEAAPDWSLLAPAAQDVVVVLAFAVSSKTMTTPAAAQVLTHWTSLPMPWPSLLAVDQRIAAEAEPARRFGLQHSMTDAWATTFLAEYGERAAAVAAALLLPAPRTIRANLLRIGSREVLATELTQVGVATKPTAFGPHGLHVTDATPLFTLPAFCSGQFEQQ